MKQKLRILYILSLSSEKRDFLNILSFFVKMFDENGTMMVFWQSLQPHPKEGKPQFVRGITAVGDSYICIGTTFFLSVMSHFYRLY